MNQDDGHTRYDVLIVGAGIAGSALAHALSTIHRPNGAQLRIALLERSLAEPDRIVGELLQPGGVMALRQLGLESCLENIGAIPCRGYCVYDNGKSVQIPYPGGHEGRSFHHGRFVMNLRGAAKKAKGVEVMEATVTDLLEDESTNRVVGVRATRKSPPSNSTKPPPTEMPMIYASHENEKETFLADLVVISDGCFSNFRTTVLGSKVKADATSHFVGVVLEDAVLPIPKHGNVALVHGSGPVLLYQISERDTRMLVDVQIPLPKDLKAHILNKVLPQLPPAIHQSIQNALNKDRLRRMPNSFLPPIKQGSRDGKKGVVLLGDSWNMRHPLTGGGMTVALHDVVQLRGLLSRVDNLSDWERIRTLLHRWYWSRKPLSSTVNILSVALYDLFAADDEELEILRTGCFKYFECGGECIDGPVSLLAGIAHSPVLLAYHFFSVAFYSIWVLFTHPRIVSTRVAASDKPTKPQVARVYEYPALALKGMRTIWTACVVFGPLLWSEIRWWAPHDHTTRFKVIMSAVLPLGLVLFGACMGWRWIAASGLAV
ncbi:Squalene epoxidase domain containing protein [Amanita muscaria]